MGVPMQSSLVHVPCKSGSPHGVFGAAQPFAAGAAFTAGACPAAGAAVSAKTAIPPANAAMDARNERLICFSLFRNYSAHVEAGRDVVASDIPLLSKEGWLRDQKKPRSHLISRR